MRKSILRRGRRTDGVAPPSQITGDMLSRRALSLHPPRSQSELPHFFHRLLGQPSRQAGALDLPEGAVEGAAH